MNRETVRANLRHVHDLGLAGAFGALLGLYLYVELVNVESLRTRDALAGALLGGSIGYAINAVGPLRDRSWQALARSASWGALAGALGGAIGLLVGEAVLGTLRGGVLGRAAGWTVLGLGIGASQGLASRSRPRLIFGLIGGGLGGFLGGFLFETLRQALGNRTDLGQGLGIVALGAGLGICLALVEQAMRRAWVVVVSGRQEGRAYMLGQGRSKLGLNERAEVGLFGDPAVSRLHAEIDASGGRYVLHPIAEGAFTAVNGLAVSGPTPLADGDRMTLGGTRLVFRRRGRSEP